MMVNQSPVDNRNACGAPSAFLRETGADRLDRLVALAVVVAGAMMEVCGPLFWAALLGFALVAR